MDDDDDDLVDMPVPRKGRPGRQSKYNFQGIPAGEDKARVFKNANTHQVNAARYQFTTTHGGKFKIRQMGDDVAVWCIEPPNPTGDLPPPPKKPKKPVIKVTVSKK